MQGHKLSQNLPSNSSVLGQLLVLQAALLDDGEELVKAPPEIHNLGPQCGVQDELTHTSWELREQLALLVCVQAGPVELAVDLMVVLAVLLEELEVGIGQNGENGSHKLGAQLIALRLLVHSKDLADHSGFQAIRHTKERVHQTWHDAIERNREERPLGHAKRLVGKIAARIGGQGRLAGSLLRAALALDRSARGSWRSSRGAAQQIRAVGLRRRALSAMILVHEAEQARVLRVRRVHAHHLEQEFVVAAQVELDLHLCAVLHLDLLHALVLVDLADRRPKAHLPEVVALLAGHAGEHLAPDDPKDVVAVEQHRAQHTHILLQRRLRAVALDLHPVEFAWRCPRPAASPCRGSPRHHRLAFQARASAQGAQPISCDVPRHAQASFRKRLREGVSRQQYPRP
eukprot:m.127437 g.127437  ORF g.127437 m.127437 type:complete len:401 (+) comp9403_c0_seq23:1452-2654(+)